MQLKVFMFSIKRESRNSIIIKIYRKHTVNFVWIKGHSNIKENERCDEIVVAAAGSKKLNKDIWYENNVANKNELF